MRRLFGIMLPLCLIAAALMMTGCSHPQSTVPPPAAVTTPPPATSAAVPSASPFQPYALVNQPSPKPKVPTHRNEVLRLTHRAGQVYLADREGHLYRCGRDRQGHVFPIYQDPATRVTYPLYYDRSRDRLYRLARNDDGHYYRGYVGDPDNRFYRDDPDYERISPDDRDRPVVTDANNRYNYDAYGYSGHHGYRVSEGTYYPAPYSPPPAHHSSHANTNWLWAIPVIVGAYLLLHPHHHSSSPPPPQGTVIVQRHNPPTVINRNITVIHTNNTVVNNNRNVEINRPAPVRPAPTPRSIALAHRPSPQRLVAPTVRPRAAVVVVPALLAAHHVARTRPVMVHRSPPILPARPGLVARPHPASAPARPRAAASVTPAPRPTHHAARPLPHAVFIHPPVRHMTTPLTHRPKPTVAAAFHHPSRESASHPHLLVAPRPQTVRRAPLNAPARPRLEARRQVHHANLHREVTRSAPLVVHHSRPAAPSHPAVFQPRRADRPRSSPRPAPHATNHRRSSPRPTPKRGAGPARKKK